MTEQEFLAEIKQGKRVLCITPEQGSNVLRFLHGHGFTISKSSQFRLYDDAPIHKDYDNGWFCPGLDMNRGLVDTWNYEYVGSLTERLSYDDFLSFQTPSVDYTNLAENMAKLFDLEVDDL